MVERPPGDVLLDLRGIRKAFGPVQALEGVDLAVRGGEVHGLIGENGAGKSTLMKVLSGALQPDAGVMLLDGNPYRVSDPAEARASGIAMIYQELTLAPHLSVEQNIMLGIERSRRGWICRRDDEVRRALAVMGHADMDLDAPVHSLSIGLKQVVEIARALVSNARVIIMDEPTSSLSLADAQALFETVRRLRGTGVSVIYISHFLEEMRAVCDRYTVLRDGRIAGTGAVAGVSTDDLVKQMIGRTIEEMYPRPRHSPGECVLRVRGLHGRQLPRGAALELRRGEILGVAGLVGSGRSETVRALFGLDRAAAGRLAIAGRPEVGVQSLSPGRALGMGMDLLSENRKDEGLAAALAVRENLTLSGLHRYRRGPFIDARRERSAAATWRERLGIRCRSIEDPVASLSGGNQQKVALGRLLHHDSDILFLDEPTRGIDVGSKAEVYRLIHGLGEAGKAVVMVSSYLPELLGVCHTVAVMHRGTLSPVRSAGDWTERELLLYATSGVLEDRP